jgi:hypothetical protein
MKIKSARATNSSNVGGTTVVALAGGISSQIRTPQATAARFKGAGKNRRTGRTNPLNGLLRIAFSAGLALTLTQACQNARKYGQKMRGRRGRRIRKPARLGLKGGQPAPNSNSKLHRNSGKKSLV